MAPELTRTVGRVAYGSIQGDPDGAPSIASINNTDGATIESTGEIGVYIDDAVVTLTNGASSTIKGAGSGIRAFGELTVDNKGKSKDWTAMASASGMAPSPIPAMVR